MSITCAGIDVSAKTLAVLLLADQDRTGKGVSLEVPNTPQGHRQLIKTLLAREVDRVICESTGVYHLGLAMALHEEKLPVMVANPRQVKRFIEARLRNTQTDPVDAYELAQFGLRMDFVPWRAPSAAAYALHRIARSLHGYVEQATAAKNRIHAAEAAPNTPRVVLKALRDELKLYDRIEQSLTAEALEIIKGDAELKRRFELLLGVRGIGETSAVQLLGELCVLASELSAKAWVKLAGLDPTYKRSGTSVETKPHISKRGNAKLRAALFMPAMSARRFDPGLAAFADRLIATGKKPMQAITAVQRKLLHGIHAMFHTNEPWDSRKLVPAQGSA